MLLTTLSLCLLVPGDAPPSAAPKPVAVTRDESKAQLEAHKRATPRLPLPPANGTEPIARVNNGRFRTYYLPKESGFGGLGGREKDSAETLDPTFKVKLFWVTSRANNCLYCLGHQEHKLAAAGVSDDGIAALDSDWAALTPAEQAAVAYTRKLTFEPHRITPADITALEAHFNRTQILEMTIAVAGFNSMNRWTDGLNIPADESGEFFRRENSTVDLSTFTTPTAEKYRSAPTRVAAVAEDAKTTCPPTWPDRPALEPRGQVEAAWQTARTRTAVLPLVETLPEEWAGLPAANWTRLLATFPKAGKSRAAGVASEAGTLSPRVRAMVAWVTAREDRAWYALAVARNRLRAQGWSDEAIFALDQANPDLPEAERLAVAFARKLAAAPGTVADADVAALRGPFTDHQVAELVHQVCNAAFLNRVTEAAQLPLDAD